MKTLRFRSVVLIFAISLAIFFLAFRAKDKNSYDIIFIGDSITESKMVANASVSGPAAMATQYLNGTSRFKEVRFSNQGHSGYTTIDFLPETRKAFPGVIKSADAFSAERKSALVFSVMLGTNDSAQKGPNGSPVSPEQYQINLKVITDSLLKRYEDAKFIIHSPIWYSDSTQNRAVYLVQGRERLQQYVPRIKMLVKAYERSHPGQVFFGDKKAFGYFSKHYLTDMNEEHGPAGTFYLHPNRKGAEALGTYWGKALAKVLE